MMASHVSEMAACNINGDECQWKSDEGGAARCSHPRAAPFEERRRFVAYDPTVGLPWRA
jgi:hypothetical protein